MTRGEQPIRKARVERNLSQKSASAYFPRELFRFLADLKRNNDRDWFAKNKGRYEKALLQPSIRFIRDAGKALKTISPYIVADPKPFGGSLFRIYRDIRFSKDKPLQDECGNGFLASENRQGTQFTRPLPSHLPGQLFRRVGSLAPGNSGSEQDSKSNLGEVRVLEESIGGRVEAGRRLSKASTYRC